MNRHALRRSFIAFHLTLGIVVLVQSLITVFQTRGGGGASHVRIGIAALAGAEAVAALLFMLPATLRLGAVSLLAIFFFAVAFHGLHGELQLTLLVYAAGVFFVMVHGSAFGKGGARQSVSA
jgi:hypothetical protein